MIVLDYHNQNLKSSDFRLFLQFNFYLIPDTVNLSKTLSLLDIIKSTKIKYLPFPGKIVGHPSVLEGTIDEITKSAVDLSSNKYVYGLDLLSYRFKGNVEALIKSVVEETKVPIVSAGSIDSEEKIKIVSDLKVWAFTVGSAAFENKFANGSSNIADQLEDILRLSNKHK